MKLTKLDKLVATWLTTNKNAFNNGASELIRDVIGLDKNRKSLLDRRINNFWVNSEWGGFCTLFEDITVSLKKMRDVVKEFRNIDIETEAILVHSWLVLSHNRRELFLANKISEDDLNVFVFRRPLCR